MARQFKNTPQMDLNGKTFDSMREGERFTTVSRRNYFLIERYTKIGPDQVQAGDGRQWNIAQTEITGSGVIVVPEGAYSCVMFDADRKGV